MGEFQSSQGYERVREGEWCQEGEWYVRRERTTRPFGHIKVEATRALMRGLAAFFTTHEWRGQVLEIWSLGCEGDVRLEGGFLTSRLRFNSFPGMFIKPFLKSKVLSEVGAAIVDVAGASSFDSRDVFIIHGHSDAARQQLKTLLLSFGLNPIVLSEQTDGGMTIIEKFEYYAKICSFAFALMTPDDKIAGLSEVDFRWRARPNVILELGWFMARLGRERVMLLSQGELEIPSDLHGLLYLPFKENVMEVAAQVSYRLRDAGLM